MEEFGKSPFGEESPVEYGVPKENVYYRHSVSFYFNTDKRDSFYNSGGVYVVEDHKKKGFIGGFVTIEVDEESGVVFENVWIPDKP